MGEGLRGGKVLLKGSASSQFLTALLMASPLAVGEPVEVVITDTLVSQPYVDMTVKLMEKFGVKVERLDGLQHLKVLGRNGGGEALAAVGTWVGASASRCNWRSRSVSGVPARKLRG